MKFPVAKVLATRLVVSSAFTHGGFGSQKILPRGTSLAIGVATRSSPQRTFSSAAMVAASTQLDDTPAAVATTATVNEKHQKHNHQDIHVPVGTDGAGEYTAATKGCFDVINKATPLILDSVQAVLRNKNNDQQQQPFAIADYGTADGGTSLGLMNQMVQQVRAQNPHQEIVIHYEDQPANEWKSVFRHSLGEIIVTDAYGQPITSPYVDDDKVFVQACGVGFHTQCFPSNTIDVGVSFTAMHWLSASPNSLKGKTHQLTMHAAQCSPSPPVPEQEQAAKDWRTILEARAREMKPKSRMILVNFCVSKEGYFLGQTSTGVSMWDSFGQGWQQLYTDKHITEEELTGVSFPNYYRTTNEFLEGVQAVPKLKVISCEEHVVPCPYREQWLAGQAKDTTTGKPIASAREYAEWFVPTTRTWSHSTFASALSSDRTLEEKESILERFWQNYVDIVEHNPNEHGMDYVHNYLVLEKEE